MLAGVNEAGQGGFAQTTKELIEGAGSAEQTRLAGIDAVLFSFSPLALVVAAIVLGTCILVSLGSRRRHLALLRSVGATRAQTFALVLVEVLVLGVLGSVVGRAGGRRPGARRTAADRADPGPARGLRRGVHRPGHRTGGRVRRRRRCSR